MIWKGRSIIAEIQASGMPWIFPQRSPCGLSRYPSPTYCDGIRSTRGAGITGPAGRLSGLPMLRLRALR
jgi:hypothetical protein